MAGPHPNAFSRETSRNLRGMPALCPKRGAGTVSTGYSKTNEGTTIFWDPSDEKVRDIHL
jgi:hypothetical protein